MDSGLDGVVLLDKRQLASKARSPHILVNSFLPNATVVGL
jgi:hypothetical protein